MPTTTPTHVDRLELADKLAKEFDLTFFGALSHIDAGIVQSCKLARTEPGITPIDPERIGPDDADLLAHCTQEWAQCAATQLDERLDGAREDTPEIVPFPAAYEWLSRAQMRFITDALNDGAPVGEVARLTGTPREVCALAGGM